MEEFFDVEFLVREIKKRPTVWDSRTLEYANVAKKQQCWTDICLAVHPNFQSLTEIRQKEIEQEIIKKWKNIRSSFTRELGKRKNPTLSAATMRKSYIYFDCLSFLLPLSSKEVTTKNLIKNNMAKEIPEQPAHRIPLSKKSKNPQACEDELLHIMKKTLERDNESGDDNRLFLSSLTPELKKVPANMQIDLKLKLLQVIKKYQSDSDGQPEFIYLAADKLDL